MDRREASLLARLVNESRLWAGAAVVGTSNPGVFTVIAVFENPRMMIDLHGIGDWQWIEEHGAERSIATISRN